MITDIVGCVWSSRGKAGLSTYHTPSLWIPDADLAVLSAVQRDTGRILRERGPHSFSIIPVNLNAFKSSQFELEILQFTWEQSRFCLCCIQLNYGVLFYFETND